MMQATGAAEAGQARPLWRAPDLVTALRIPLAAAFIVFADPVVRFAVVVLAGVSDIADGIWARRLGGSRLGAVLDPVCDKLFVGAGFLVVYQSGLLSPLEVAGALLRDILAVAGFIAVTLLRRPTTLPARAGGKAVTVCQLLTLLAFVTGSELLRPLAWATAAISVYAIADYGSVAWKR